MMSSAARPMFPFEPSLFLTGGLILVLSVVLLVLMVVVGLFSETEVAWLAVLLSVPAIAAFAAMGAYFWHRHWGAVVLLEEELVLVRGKKVRARLRYDEITGVQLFDRHLPPNLTLIAGDGCLRLSGKLVGLHIFYRELCTRAPAVAEARPVGLPFELDAGPHLRREILGAALFLALLFYGIFAYSMLAHGQTNWLEGFSIITSIWAFFSGLVALLALRPGFPVRVAFDPPRAEPRSTQPGKEPSIRAWSVLGRKVRIPLSDVEAFEIGESVQDVGEGVVNAKKRTFPIRIIARPTPGKASERTILIDEVLARAGGHRTASLFQSLRGSYPGIAFRESQKVR